MRERAPALSSLPLKAAPHLCSRRPLHPSLIPGTNTWPHLAVSFAAGLPVGLKGYVGT